MAARWYRWPVAGGQAKIELVKFDRSGRPIVEQRGRRRRGMWARRLWRLGRGSPQSRRVDSSSAIVALGRMLPSQTHQHCCTRTIAHAPDYYLVDRDALFGDDWVLPTIGS